MTCPCDQVCRDGCVLICQMCGSEKRHLVPTSTVYSDVLYQCVYSRKKRFESLFNSVVTPHFDKRDEEVFKALEGKKFKTTAEIIPALKKLCVRDKRFCSIHLMARHFCPSYVPPKVNVRRLRSDTMRVFDTLLTRYKLHQPASNFFSYPWLLKHLFHAQGVTCFDPFIKSIKCRHRRLFYEGLVEELLTPLNGYTRA